MDQKRINLCSVRTQVLNYSLFIIEHTQAKVLIIWGCHSSVVVPTIEAFHYSELEFPHVLSTLCHPQFSHKRQLIAWLITPSSS